MSSPSTKSHLPSRTPSERLLDALTLLLIGALALFLLVSGCADDDPEAEDSDGTPGRATLPLAHQGVTDEPRPAEGVIPTNEQILGLDREPEPKVRKSQFKELAFEVQAVGEDGLWTWRENPTLADLDGDGFDDLVASNREEDGLNIWRSLAGQGWEHRIEGLPRNLMYGGSAAADLDHDGDVDLIFASHKKHARVFLNEGGEMVWRELEVLESPFLSLDIQLGNLNGDEHHDAVSIAQFAVQSSAGGGLNVYLGRGDGTFERQHHLSGTMGSSRMGQQVELADFDHDGLDDLVLTAERGALVKLTRLAADGTLSFEDRSAGLPRPASIGNSFRSVVAADFTGDGELEVAFACLSDPAIEKGKGNYTGLYRWNGSEWEQFDRGLPRDQGLRDADAADFDGDGHTDLLLVGPGWGAVIFLGDGTGGFTVAGALPNTLPGGRTAVGDVDADGKVDVALTVGATKRNRQGGGVRVFLNRDAVWEK